MYHFQVNSSSIFLRTLHRSSLEQYEPLCFNLWTFRACFVIFAHGVLLCLVGWRPPCSCHVFANNCTCVSMFWYEFTLPVYPDISIIEPLYMRSVQCPLLIQSISGVFHLPTVTLLCCLAWNVAMSSRVIRILCDLRERKISLVVAPMLKLDVISAL